MIWHFLHGKVITTVGLITTCYHIKLLEYCWLSCLCCALHPHDLSCYNWRFILLNYLYPISLLPTLLSPLAIISLLFVFVPVSLSLCGLTCLMITAAFRTSTVTSSKQQSGVRLWYSAFEEMPPLTLLVKPALISLLLVGLKFNTIVCSFSEATVVLKHKGGHSFPRRTWWRLSHRKNYLVPNLTYLHFHFTDQHVRLFCD